MALKVPVLLLLSLTLFLVGCQLGFTFTFTLDNEPVDGAVYLNNLLLGQTENGKLTTEALSPGTLTIEGTHRNRPFSFSYDIKETDLTTKKFEIKLPADYFDYFTLKFTSDNFPIDGDVIINNKKVGETYNGEIKLPIEEVFPGLLTFEGTYLEEPFSFDFQIPRTYLDDNELSFNVPFSSLEELVYTVDDLNERTIALLVLQHINNEREAPKDLKRNTDIETLADAYAVTLETTGFHHTDDEGKGVGDRFKDEELFYTIAGENLYYATNLNDVNEQDVAQMAIDGWLESPGHRSLVKDRDGLFTDAGIGVHCTDKTCYIVFNAAGMQEDVDRDLAANTCSLISLYDPSFPFTYDTRVTIDIDATDDLNIYLVDDSDAIDDCVQRKNIDEIDEWIGTDELIESRNVQKGYYLLLETTTDTEVTGTIRYNE